MGRKTCLVLYKDEWERLKKQAGPHEKPVERENQYLKSLIDKSQKWVRTWPDTIQGHIAQVKKQQEKQHAMDIAMVKSYARKKKKDKTNEAIKKARQLIFEDSCYGKQLISALTESKTLEERDVQVLFHRDLKQKAAEEKRQPNKNVYCSFDLDKQQAEIHRAKQTAASENAQFNKEICEINRNKIAKSYDKEKLNRQEQEEIMKQLHFNETLEKHKYSLAEKQSMKEFQIEQRQHKDHRVKRDELTDIAVERHKKHQEIIKCKIQQVFKEIYKDRQDTALSKNNYKLIENIKEEEKKRYEEFIEKGIKDFEQRISTKEQEKAEMQKLKQSSVRQCKKISAETIKGRDATKTFCDRQSILPKSHKIPFRGEKGDKGIEKPCQQFFVPCNNLIENLMKREKEPSPFSGTTAAHAQFAAQADDILRLCAYKNKARKVIDGYMKQNCLDSLPLTNY